jgi:ring-1,2-phenylacetyl-CoA epoxidase subunit PaaB
MGNKEWPLWEVFIRSKQGLNHKHVGSLRAPDSEMAIKNARDVYTRRSEGVSIWVTESKNLFASNPYDADSLYEPSDSKVYRHPSFYEVPDGIEHM